MLWITRWAPHPDNFKANFNVLAQANQLLMSTLSTSATSSPNLLTKQEGPVVITTIKSQHTKVYKREIRHV